VNIVLIDFWLRPHSIKLIFEALRLTGWALNHVGHMLYYFCSIEVGLIFKTWSHILLWFRWRFKCLCET